MSADGPVMAMGFARLLQNSTESSEDDERQISNDLDVLRNTLIVYGGIFIFLFLIFCWARQRYPGAYNIRSWLDDWKTPLADDQYGFFNWSYKMFLISDTEIMDECGMDALCFIHVLQFGFKIASFGMLNALWLIPVYATAEGHEDTEHITDPVVSITTTHLPEGSVRFIATAIASYMTFGYTMFCLLQEFTWFYNFRHRFLIKKVPRNYAVFVRCIPKEYRSNEKLLKFFRECVSPESVLDANIVIKTPQLKKKVAEREAIIGKLEHAINMEEVLGVTPTSRSMGIAGDKVNVIEELYGELNELNADIGKSITEIEQANNPTFSAQETESRSPGRSQRLLTGSVNLDEASAAGGDVSILTVEEASDASKQKSKKPLLNFGFESESGGAADDIKEFAALPLKGIKGIAGAAKGLLDAEDGEPEASAFITFKSIRSVQCVLQMLHYPRPFAMEALEAPSPEDVFWPNAGKTHKELQMGKLLSFFLTTALCLFWTIPMSFISTLSTVEGLREEVKFIDDLLHYSPWLVPVFAQLAPLLIVVANEVLKIILEILSMLEGPISGAVVQSSLFSKLATFMIIQTFFVSAISGNLFAALQELIDDPIGRGIPLLADNLPSQSTFFVQVLLVDTFINMGVEILRVVPVACAYLRRFVGPNLTEKERNTTFLGIRPFSDPWEFEHADVLAGSVLYFMVFFVYAPIAPLVCFFMSGCFLLMNACYRHQFIYIYPTFPDSGGYLWLRFIGIMPACMLIAEITIIGMCSLKKSIIAVGMMAPLIIVTVIFRIYVGQKHFELALYLTTHDAVATDLNTDTANYDFVEGKYVQPELRDKNLQPENGSVQREIDQGGEVYATPNHSEADENENEEREREFGVFGTL